VRTMRKRNAVRGEHLKGKVGVLRLSTTGARTFQSAATFETAALATFFNSANRSRCCGLESPRSGRGVIPECTAKCRLVRPRANPNENGVPRRFAANDFIR